MTTRKFGCADCGRVPFNTKADVRKHHKTDCPAWTDDKKAVDHGATVDTLFGISIAIAASLLAGAFRFFEPRG
jgi:hypothetical protein